MRDNVEKETMLSSGAVKEAVAEALIEASTSFREDQVRAYERAIAIEDNPNAKWALERILENAQVAQDTCKPVCNDTGIPHLYLEIGSKVSISGEFFDWVREGVRIGLRRLPGRPMAVRGDDLERLGQVKGLFQDPGELTAAPFQIRDIPDNKIVITVIMLGGGPDIRARTYRVFHRHRGMNVIDEVAKWAVEEVGRLGCTPTIPSIGIGRTHYEATCLMLEAMKEGNLLNQNDLEKRITDALNATNVGPLGLRGRTTALASFIKIGSFRAGGSRMVSLRLGCCWEPRRATKEIAL
jgi:fumarate hydratase subunit alpha